MPGLPENIAQRMGAAGTARSDVGVVGAGATEISPEAAMAASLQEATSKYTQQPGFAKQLK